MAKIGYSIGNKGKVDEANNYIDKAQNFHDLAYKIQMDTKKELKSKEKISLWNHMSK